MAREIALVTGASRGIGRAVALELARRGLEVWLGFNGRVPEAAMVRDQIVERGGTAVLLPFDIADPDACAKQLREQLTATDPVSVLVHSAGVLHQSLLLRTTPHDWSRVLSVNLTGFYNVSRVVLRGMIQRRRGAIVAIGSVAGSRGIEGQTAYAASKAGLIGAVRSLAREVGRFNVRVNIVAPGWIATDMTRERSAETVIPRIPLGRIGRPEEVAHLVSFLCSSEASYVTGAVVPVSGGLDM